MRRLRVPAALLTFALAGACSPFPLAERPLAPAVDLALDDQREWMPDYVPGYGPFFLYFVPLVPFFTTSDRNSIHASLVPEVKSALERSRLFGGVTAAGDPGEARARSPLVATVRLLETRATARATTYLLGFPAILLHLIGFPLEWGGTTASLEVEVRDRAGRVVARGVGEDTDLGFRWIYEDQEPWERGHRDAALDEALAEALEACRLALERR